MLNSYSKINCCTKAFPNFIKKSPEILIIIGIAISILIGVNLYFKYQSLTLKSIKLKGALAAIIGGGVLTSIGIGILFKNSYRSKEKNIELPERRQSMPLGEGSQPEDIRDFGVPRRRSLSRQGDQEFEGANDFDVFDESANEFKGRAEGVREFFQEEDDKKEGPKSDGNSQPALVRRSSLEEVDQKEERVPAALGRMERPLIDFDDEKDPPSAPVVAHPIRPPVRVKVLSKEERLLNMLNFVRHHFKDFKINDDSWDIGIEVVECRHAMLIPGGMAGESVENRYKIIIPAGSNYYSKLYSVFCLLKEAKIIPKERIFDIRESVEALIPLLTQENIEEFVKFFQEQENFKELMEAIFVEIDDTLFVGNGGEEASNFYVRNLDENDEFFRTRFSISKEAVECIRNEGSGLVYLGAIQIGTKCDELVQLLERYYVDLDMKDKKNNKKEFMIHTKETPGMVRRSNLSPENYDTLKGRLEHILYIKEKTQYSSQRLFQEELNGKLVGQFAALEVARIRRDIIEPNSALEEVSSERQKLLLKQAASKVDTKVREIEDKLLKCTSYKDLDSYVTKLWEIALNYYSSVGPAGFTPAPNPILQEDIIREVYGGQKYEDEKRGEKFDILCQKLKANRGVALQIEALLESEKSKATLDDFAKIAREKITFNLPGARFSGPEFADKALGSFEEIIYRLYFSSTEQQINDFCMQWSGVVWQGCGAGLDTKFEILKGLLGGALSIDQTLMKRRLQLIEDFINLHYSGMKELVMYITGTKLELTSKLGLTISEDKVMRDAYSPQYRQKHSEAYMYVSSNYTPMFVFQSVFDLVQKRLEISQEESSHEQKSSHGIIRKLLQELGVSEREEQEYRSLSGGYNLYKIQLDLRKIVFNYCINKQYLLPRRNFLSESEYFDSYYRRRLALAARSQAKAAEQPAAAARAVPSRASAPEEPWHPINGDRDWSRPRAPHEPASPIGYGVWGSGYYRYP